MTSSTYPRIKVFFAFLLCPFFAGLVAVPLMLISIMVTVFENSSLIGEVRGGEVFSLFITIPLMAQLIFFLPSLVFALSLVFIKPVGGFKVYVVVSVVGAIVSSVWMFGVVFFFINKVENYQIMRNIFPVVLSFLLGGGSTWAAAYWFLPQSLPSE
ncbi:hypothetical protein [Pseudomonas haemolytica]|uniref:Uncharacterized protein n=1 Tax=Pseudomonas haemolytica TaxID=2600065 RepID=A0A5P1DFD5_9PSED|nr:hypothetical protein [Pseudomonas haemolytica]MBJ2246478.1 hypothetical protein [Pseudomonas haemolytica]MBJ2274174.1 hypothetical protein [Pseudomonas haemolytica]MBK3448250.1 hypothetical protein [Pseudomonas haemolytica]MBK3462891.1 hypothetical protein [Pseudomonas haemolytica]MRJ38630.1 hypothetical protein [Pseudomonas haemolytica]